VKLQRTALAALVSLLAGCTDSGNVNGTLRDNQRTLLQTGHWQDERCSERTAGNCCERNGSFCLDFTDVNVDDVRVSGRRVVALIAQNNGHLLAISDDLGGSWRTVTLGSVGGIAQVRPMALHLDGNDVYLMVANQEQGAGIGSTTRVRPVRVDLGSGSTSPVASDWFLVGTVPAYVRDGVSVGVSFSPEDERGGGTCVALEETWDPGARPVRRSARFEGSCSIGLSVTGSDDGRLFSYLSDADGGPACLLQYDASTSTASRRCVPLAEWPARSEPRVLASYANERAELMRAFAVQGQAFVASPSLASPIALGPGVPRAVRALGGRSRYAGLVVLGDPAGRGSTLVRVKRDGTVDEVLLPRGPCSEDPTRSCFDPANPGISHGEYGDALWIEPLGGDEFLVFWLHDRAPGINQYQGVLTVSRERATYRPRTGLMPFEAFGPPGHPNATRAGVIEEICVRRQTCTPAREDFHMCVNRLLQENATTPRLQAALDAASAARCSDPIYTEPGWLDCLLRGGMPSNPDNGQGQRFFQCDPGPAITPTPCPAGRGLNPICVGDVGERCLAGNYTRTRCDLMNMACDASSQTVAWRPCVARQLGPPVVSPDQLRCDGRYLLWDINGTHWADCRALGFSQCVGRRCEP